MNDLQETLRALRTDLDNERRVRVCIQEAAALDRSRITAMEDANNVQAHYFPELRETIRKFQEAHAAAVESGKNRSAIIARNVVEHHDEINAVLEAHTTAIFRQETRLDAIAEHFAAAGFAIIKVLQDEDLTDEDRPDPEGGVDRTQRLINSTGTDAGHGFGPLRT